MVYKKSAFLEHRGVIILGQEGLIPIFVAFAKYQDHICSKLMIS